MTAKTFEVRDKGTFIAVLAVQLESGNERDRFLLNRSGFGKTSAGQKRYVLLYKLYSDGFATYDAFRWEDSTTQQAHLYINEYFDGLISGQVIDCEFLRGESRLPKVSEIV